MTTQLLNLNTVSNSTVSSWWSFSTFLTYWWLIANFWYDICSTTGWTPANCTALQIVNFRGSLLCDLSPFTQLCNPKLYLKFWLKVKMVHIKWQLLFIYTSLLMLDSQSTELSLLHALTHLFYFEFVAVKIRRKLLLREKNIQTCMSHSPGKKILSLQITAGEVSWSDEETSESEITPRMLLNPGLQFILSDALYENTLLTCWHGVSLRLLFYLPLVSGSANLN